MFKREVLIETLAELGLTPVFDPFDELCRKYNEPDRYYHTSRHIAECLCQWDIHKDLCERQGEVAVAIWFHDAIYDPRRHDNESRSAAWANDYLMSEGMAADAVDRITAIIRCTETHNGRSADERLMCDIDLAILAADPATFSRYDADIRKEYSWVPDEAYRSARRRVLRDFLDRERIYFTHTFHQRYELQARENIRLCIERLGE